MPHTGSTAIYVHLHSQIVYYPWLTDMDKTKDIRRGRFAKTYYSRTNQNRIDLVKKIYWICLALPQLNVWLVIT